MSFARQFQDINAAAQILYNELFISIDDDLRNHTDSYDSRRSRIYGAVRLYMSIFGQGTAPILDACISTIQYEEIMDPRPGSMQSHIHQTMRNELTYVRDELMSARDMTAAPSNSF